MLDVMAVYLGDRLDLYRTLQAAGPMTAGELAERAGIDERYAREWLEQQAATDLLDVEDPTAEPEARRFSLPEAYADALTDPDSPYSIAPLGRSLVACAKALPLLLEAYRTGDGVAWADYGPDMIEAQGDFNRPWLVNDFGSTILPAMTDIHARLTGDPPARVADIACGVGWAAIALARAYPTVIVDGYDLDAASIALAQDNARRNAVADRVTFAQRDASDATAVGQFDLALIIESVHDMSRPVEVLAAVRGMLGPSGVLLVADEKTEDRFTAPAGELERLFYGYSILTCLPAARTERPTAATGTVMREDTMRRYAREAGFMGFERIDPPELETLRFYRLTP
ncbi:MAG TPA: methyltransferase domain-containing protein [Candidatus Limnocylindria bacterium]|nr:methyltransferase domain-containing protein [Candidatus Limnocylindria bacterium]